LDLGDGIRYHVRRGPNGWLWREHFTSAAWRDAYTLRQAVTLIHEDAAEREQHRRLANAS
jgi:hypothetical protein